MTHELSEQARAMLERALAEERPLVPGAPRRAQLKRSLLHGAALASANKAAAASVTHGLATSAGASKVAALSLGPLAKGIAVGLLVSGGLMGTVQVFSAAPLPATVPAVTPAPRAVPDGAAALAPGPTPAVAASASPSAGQQEASLEMPARSSSRDVAPAAEVEAGLAAELQLLNAVQAALRDGRSAQALTLLQRYDQSFPQGQLLGERLAAEVFAACLVDNRARATRAAERFLRQDATSVLAGRVKRSCAFEQKGNEP